ncbi:CidA/LrgA family protein [Bacillus taeanensis]|uniref:CidA/LrgA family protein n=1 Tax=Bacillus taeanensis TaxID=273032 RepID=A0A366Y0P6_9BACI|nr:CidA/LrgA family holin-like protein [Bacillus taeanensis]RBW71418.1 CidA/LrgA family protein [Bacillus taeanensis]
MGRKSLNIIFQVAILYGIYQVGVWLQEGLNLFIPGSMIGMLLLVSLLALKVIPIVLIEEGASFMLRHLPFFFLPVTAGIINYFQLFKGKGFLLILVTLLSTIVVMVTAGLTSQQLAKRGEKQKV